MALTPASAGIGSPEFISQVRDELEDAPRFRGTEVASGNGTATVFQIPNAPVYDGFAYGTPFWVIKVGVTVQTLVTRYEDLAAGKVFVDYLTGVVVFGTAPGAGTNNVTFSHASCRWLNRRIERALNDGLNAMFPTVYQWQSAVLATAVNKWEYALPSAFFDPRVRILEVEIREIPAATERYRPISMWRRTADNTLMIQGSQAYSPGASVRVQYTAPYSSLGELERQVAELPVLYAKGTLLGGKEAPRSNSDVAAVTGGANANPNGVQRDAGAIYLNQFYKRLGELERAMPMAPPSSTYGR
jgi:hypothetical protein